MIFLSHLLIGDLIYKEIVARIDIKLDKVSFLYGNVKPDICNKDIKHEHIFNESINILEEYINEIKGNEESIKKFSENIGVISHFVSDYFCLYHIGEYGKKNIISHILYETILHFRFLYMTMVKKITFIEEYEDRGTIKGIIQSMQNNHNLGKQTIDKDIVYALSTSILVLTPIILGSKVYETLVVKNKIKLPKKRGEHSLRVDS